MYVIKSESGGKVYYLGNVGKNGQVAYALVNPDDKRVLRFGSPSGCIVTFKTIRQQFRSQRLGVAWEDDPIIAAAPKYVVLDRRLRDGNALFASDKRKAVYEWILHGLRGTQGAERDHYVSCLLQLEDGKTQLYYDLDA